VSIEAYCHRVVCSVGPDATLREAALRMEKEGVGLLVVMEEERPRGVLTDRDVALRAAADGTRAGEGPVRDAMSRPPVGLPADASLPDAAARLASSRLRRLLVTEGDRVRGILSADDLVRLLASELADLGEVLQAQLPAGSASSLRAEDAAAEMGRAVHHYQSPVVTASSETPVAELVRRMDERAVGSVVILDDDGRAVGLVTDRDLALRVVAAGLDPATASAASVMSTPLVSAEPGEPLEAVVARMRGAGVRRIPVLSEGRPTGLVSFDDVLVTLGRELHDIGRGVAGEIRAARLRSYSERVRVEVEERLEEAAGVLRQLGDQALRGVARELEGAYQRVAGPVRRTVDGMAAQRGAAEAMCEDVGTCSAEATAAEAARILWERDCGLVPVLAPDGSRRVVGVVTDRDLCMAAYIQGRRLAEIPLREIMSTRLHTCSPQEAVDQVLARMGQAQVRRLPVVDEQGRLRGVLSLADLARAERPSAAEVAATLRAICRPRAPGRPGAGLEAGEAEG